MAQSVDSSVGSWKQFLLGKREKRFLEFMWSTDRLKDLAIHFTNADKGILVFTIHDIFFSIVELIFFLISSEKTHL